MFDTASLVNHSLDLLSGEGGDALSHDVRRRERTTKDGCRQDEGVGDRIIPFHIIGGIGFGIALRLGEGFGVALPQRHRNDFVRAKDWETTRQVLETRQELLYQPEVEAVFALNIQQARSAGEARMATALEQRLAVLRECKAHGMEETFVRLITPSTRPSDHDLISRSIAALCGSPQVKMAWMQQLTTLAFQTHDEGLKVLLEAIQLALVGEALSRLGNNLSGG